MEGVESMRVWRWWSEKRLLEERDVAGACEGEAMCRRGGVKCGGWTCRVKGIGPRKESSLVKPYEKQAGVSGESRLEYA